MAQFVGSPPMNLVMAKVGADGDKLRLEVGGSTVEIPESVIARTPGTARPSPARTIALGIRSEDMEDATISAVPAERRMKGKVTLTELLGSEVIVHFTFPGRRSKPRTPSSSRRKPVAPNCTS